MSVVIDSRTDAELLEAARADPAAFRELYDRWAEPLLAYFMRRVFDAELAADLCAETFAVAYQRRARFRDIGRPGASWLFGIAAKELSRYHRRRRVETRALARLGVEVPELDDESASRIQTLVDTDARRSALDAGLGAVPPAEREALELRVVGELSYAEVALRLGCSEVAARVRVHRGLARLSTLMEDSE